MLISSGHLKPVYQLPPECLLAGRFGVGRSYIKEPILKFAFYVLLKTSPQSGNYLSGFGTKILDSIFEDIITFSKDDFASLIEARYYLKVNSAKLAAERRTEADLIQLIERLAEYDAKFATGMSAADEDLLFHIKIAVATRNSVLESMIIILVPDLIELISLLDRRPGNNKKYNIEKHHKFLDTNTRQDADGAATEMGEHLREIMEDRNTIWHPV